MMPLALEPVLIGPVVVRPLAAGQLQHAVIELNGQGARNVACQFLMQNEDVGDLAVIPLRPHLICAADVGQVGGDANMRTNAPDAAVEQIVRAELTADGLCRIGPPAIGEGGCPGNDRQVLEARKLSDDVLGHPV